MRQLCCILLSLSVASSLASGCSPRAYLGWQAMPTTGQGLPVLASATVVAPQAIPIPSLRSDSAHVAPALARRRPTPRQQAAEVPRTTHNARANYHNYLVVNSIRPALPVRVRHRTSAVAGTPTGLEGLGNAILAIALLLFVFFALLGIALMLLVKLLIHLIWKAKRPRPQAGHRMGCPQLNRYSARTSSTTHLFNLFTHGPQQR
jgi:hypothetical protein